MIEIRPCRDEGEKKASLEIYNEVYPADRFSFEDVLAWEAAMRDSIDLLAVADRAPVGSGTAAIMPSRPHLVFALVAVLPEARRQGVGSSLYAVISEWAAARGLDALETRIAEDDADSLAFAARRGFDEVARNRAMVLDVAQAPRPCVDPPAGIEVVGWNFRSELERGIYEVLCEAYPDIPGEEDWTAPPFEHWREHFRAPGDRPGSILLALADGEVVGYARLRLTSARPGSATHSMVGVRRAWRGRGIASALKRAQIAWAEDAGLEQLETENEVGNEPIRRINAKLGYVPVPGRVFLRGPLAPA